MSSISRTCIVLMLLVTLAGCTSTLLFPARHAEPQPGPVPPWLSTHPADPGYVKVSAKLVWPPGQPRCLSPGPKGFDKGRLRMVFTAQPQGFASCVPEYEIPFFAKSLPATGGKLCEEAESTEMVIVPYVALEDREPLLTFWFLYAGEKEADMTASASELRDAASAVTTAASAVPVAGLTHLVSADQASRLSHLYAPLTAPHVKRLAVDIPLSRTMLTAGQTTFSLPIYRADVLQTRDGALTVSQGYPAGDKVFDVVFSIEFRRTLFGSEPLAEPYLPQLTPAADTYVLNYPNIGPSPVPTIVQRLNQLSPTLITRLGSEDHYREACREARRSIKALCLTAADSAIVYHALLNAAHGNDEWRSQPQFIHACLDDDLAQLLDALYGKGQPYIQPAWAPTFKDIPTDAPPVWRAAMGQMMEDLSFAFSSKERVNAQGRFLVLLDPAQELKIAAHAGAWDVTRLGDGQRNEVKAAELARITVKEAGCHVPGLDAVHGEGESLAQHTGYMALVVEEGEGQSRRDWIWYVLAHFADDKRHPLIGLTLYRDVDPTIKNHIFDRSYIIAAACEEIKKKARGIGAY